MSGPETSREDLSEVLERFPAHADDIRRLAAESETFRNICEDYALAQAMLARLEAALKTEGTADKLLEYRALASELEENIAAVLQVTR